MASMDTLIKEIYFEQQQEGSMLCAQHALNSLLQGEYFTAPDLATIATRLDQLESGYDDANIGETSTNMDDTGFFSIQVIEEALKPWSLGLRRWRSEAMLPYHEQPHCQLAFILNSQQHWYTLRRFGEALPDFTEDPGIGHWFDLNSFNKNPLWVGKTYLGMTLQQAEAVGYSVFAVVQEDLTKPLALPRSESDHIAAFVTEESRPSAAYRSGEAQPSARNVLGFEDFDDDDAEFQAALQASISGNTYDDLPSLPQPFIHPPLSSGSTRSSTLPIPSRTPPPFATAQHRTSLPPLRRPTAQDVEMIDDDDDDDDDDFHAVIPPFPQPPTPPLPDLDMIAASRARNQAYMAQVMREQEAALQESMQAEIAALESGQQTRRRRDPRRQAEEDELQRAIEESRALHETQGTSDGDEGKDDDEEYRQPLAPFRGDERVYDDDDAALQAALQASLADVPEGLTVPCPPPRATAALSSQSPATPVQEGERDTEISSEADTTVADSEDMEVEREQLSVDEMRRRRLARFGG
ncbi:Josephin-domain-containing protein [Cytidiella melzeri]|nr:Josephin-domain-containing protein [Cytidiella melzeri]